MSDFDRESMLLEAVHEFRSGALPYVHPAGTAAVRTTVRRRRQTRLVALAALVAILVLAPVAAFAAFERGTHHSPPTGLPSSSPSAGPSGSASPSASPSGTPSSSSPPPPAQPVDLSNARFALGDWRPLQGMPQACPTGIVTFTKGVAQLPNKAPVYVRTTALVDVDHDGISDVAVTLWCEDGQAGTFQALVLKAAPDGSLTTLGEVARSGQNGDNLLAVASGDGGLVNLTVGDIIPCCATPQSVVLTQVRGFAWNGTAFTQVTGPTTFTADRSVADLQVSAPPVRYTAASGGQLAGTLTVTIHNKGPRVASRATLLVWYEASSVTQPVAGGSWDKCAGGAEPTRICQLGDIAAGATVTLTLPLRTEFAQGITLQPRVGDQKYDDLHIASTS